MIGFPYLTGPFPKGATNLARPSVISTDRGDITPLAAISPYGPAFCGREIRNSARAGALGSIAPEKAITASAFAE